MKYLKKLGISFLYILGTILVLTLIITILSYFDIISDGVVSVFKILIPCISLIIGGFYIGKHSSKKGFLEGAKLGLIYSVIITIFDYLAFDYSFKIKYLLFFSILIVSSIMGSMIGINRKK